MIDASQIIAFRISLAYRDCLSWRLNHCPQICFDLRFPISSRNSVSNNEFTYDCLLYVANWPNTRARAWRTLLEARAIENQAYCIGVNRVGSDQNGLTYQGDSSVFDAMGEELLHLEDREQIATVSLSYTDLSKSRKSFPFLQCAKN